MTSAERVAEHLLRFVEAGAQHTQGPAAGPSVRLQLGSNRSWAIEWF
ncbi:hypothetical protein ABZ454_02655 [Streptomyces sp. NPDC005803]